MKKNPIDLLVTEWAYRCKKGYPDIKNKEDKMVLDTIMKEWTLQEQEEGKTVTVDSLIKLLRDKGNTLTQDKLEKLYTTVEKINKELGSKLKEKLESKKLKDIQIYTIQAYADKNNIEDQIVKSIENTSNTFNNLPTQGNLTEELTKLSQIDSKHVNFLLNLSVSAQQKGVGKGELALIALLHDVQSAKKGDIEADGMNIEVKGAGSILTHVITRGEKVDSLKEKIRKSLEVPDSVEVKAGNWVETLHKLSKTEGDIEKTLNDLYKGQFKFKISKKPETAEELKLEITRQLTDDYFDKHAPILMVNESKAYRLFTTKNELLNELGTGIKVVSLSDLAPRLTYLG
jgi:hypothetical protein